MPFKRRRKILKQNQNRLKKINTLPPLQHSSCDRLAEFLSCAKHALDYKESTTIGKTVDWNAYNFFRHLQSNYPVNFKMLFI